MSRIDPYDNQWHSAHPAISEALVVRIVLTYVAVGIRLYSKTIRGHRVKFGFDDAFTLLALVSSTAGAGAALWGLSNTAPGNPQRTLSNYYFAVYLCAPIDAATLTFVRLSILSFYRTIFTAHPRLDRFSSGMFVFSIIWAIAGIFGSIFMCDPISHYWKPRPGGVCHNFSLFFLIMVTVEIIMDAIILIQPLPTLGKLNLSLRMKAGVIGIFSVGIFCVATNILRLKYIYSATSNYIDITKDMVWSSVHISSAIICACLPFYKPLVVKTAALSASMASRLFSGLRTHRDATLGSDSESDKGKPDLGPESGKGIMKVQQVEQRFDRAQTYGREWGHGEPHFPRVVKINGEFEVV